MTDPELYTRCPTCRTVFRTYEFMLEMQGGKVRCGQCRMVFDGRSHLVEVAFDDAGPDEPPPPPAVETIAPRAPTPQAAPFSLDAPEEFEVPPLAPAPTDPEVPAVVPSPESPAGGDAKGAGPGDADDSPVTLMPPNDEVTRIGTGPTPPPVVPPKPAEPVPYPQIGIDDDPLGIRAVPAARGTGAQGPSTITGSSNGPATVGRFGDTIAKAFPRNGGSSDSPRGSASGKSREGRDSIDDAAVAHQDPVVMPDWKSPAPPARRGARWAFGILSVLLAVALVGQVVFHYRNVIAADYPVTRPHLVAACIPLGCRIEPLRNRDEITIESHDLQADPGHQGLLILQTTLRNQARHALAFPHLELVLDDNAGKPIVRRVFAPADYAGGAADFSLGIPANAEWNVKLFLDASGVPAGAYHLYHFYP